MKTFSEEDLVYLKAIEGIHYFEDRRHIRNHFYKRRISNRPQLNSLRSLEHWYFAYFESDLPDQALTNYLQGAPLSKGEIARLSYLITKRDENKGLKNEEREQKLNPLLEAELNSDKKLSVKRAKLLKWKKWWPFIFVGIFLLLRILVRVSSG